jgi:hypothetical protein
MDGLCVLSKRYSRIGGARSWRTEGTEEQASKREGLELTNNRGEIVEAAAFPLERWEPFF